MATVSIKDAQALDRIRHAGIGAFDHARNAGTGVLDQVKGIWAGLSAEQKQMIIRSLIGGGVGAGVLGGSRLLSGRDEEDRGMGSVMPQLLLGLLLGGGAGAASTMLPRSEGINSLFTPKEPDPRGLGEAAVPFLGGAAGLQASNFAMRNRGPYDRRALEELNRLTASGALDQGGANSSRKAIQSYQDFIKNRANEAQGRSKGLRVFDPTKITGTGAHLPKHTRGTFLQNFVDQSDTVAMLNDSNLFNRLRSRGGKLNPLKHVPRETSKGNLFKHMNTATKGSVKPQMLGRSGKPMAALASMLGAGYLSKRITDSIMDRR